MRYRTIALALAASLALAACGKSNEAAPADTNLTTENVSDESFGGDNLSAIDAAPLDNATLDNGALDNSALPADDLGNATGNATDAPGNAG